MLKNLKLCRPITLDDIYHCGLFDTVGQSDVSLNLAALAENNYESIFDLLLVLQKTTTSYLRTRAVEIESELQQCNSEKENFRKELTILIQVITRTLSGSAKHCYLCLSGPTF